MASRVGSELEATITGVESFGMFCQGLEIPAEGMIHLSALGDDFFEFDPVGRTLTGQRTRHVYRLGDNLRVWIVAVDVDRRQMELRPVRAFAKVRRPAEEPAAAPQRSVSEKRSASEKSSRTKGKQRKGSAGQTGTGKSHGSRRKSPRSGGGRSQGRSR
jgi:ribonuclease R